jgi:shikimate dehydrogenase
MNISKDTVMCISIAAQPSNVGTTLMNAAFQAMRLDFLYKAFRVEADGLEGAITGMRALSIRGCGISMPHKTPVMSYLDTIDGNARRIGAVNTVVNNNGTLAGYNTDYFGALTALRKSTRKKINSALMLGAGGVASAIAYALKELDVKQVSVANRSRPAGIAFARRQRFSFVPWEKRNEVTTDLLVNATPIGMRPKTREIPLDEAAISGFKIVMDVVANPLESRLIQIAKRKRKVVVSGYAMSLHQAAKQCELYTGRKAPMPAFENALCRIVH